MGKTPLVLKKCAVGETYLLNTKHLNFTEIPKLTILSMHAQTYNFRQLQFRVIFQ